MPLSSKGKKLMKKFIETYGNEKAKEVFYASKNKGTIAGVEESSWNTYRLLGAVLAETRRTKSTPPNPEDWRTWPLDPKDPSKGTLSAQKSSAQEKPKARGGSWSSEQQRTFAPTSRVRVTTPADDLGIKGTKTHHTTSKGRGAGSLGIQPQLVKKRTSVKGSSEGKQIKVSDFPTSHSAKKTKNESSWTEYKKLGIIIAEKQKAGALGVAPMSDKQKKKRELQAQANSDKDLEL